MKELDFNFKFKDLAGQEITESNAGKLLSNILSDDRGKNPVKLFSWALAFFDGKAISLDPQDLELLKNLVIETQGLNALTKAQILEVITRTVEK